MGIPADIDPAALLDGFDVLDECHRQSLFMLGRLAALITRLGSIGADSEARSMAADIVRHFSTTVRQHHADEERYVFPKLASLGNADVTQAVLRLQCDHDWLEENWMELSPQLDAVACGLNWFDLDTLREAAQVFIALSHDHIALEESFIYPEAKARLQGRERSNMGRDMAARRAALRRKAAAPGTR
ncbi:hemerythrin domain-containing protein [Piscinibacter terrae]|uniref:Hemerythrin domain-containing protein n=1 Tax=Piscinibacter terrae TaxID=2496871 RepID=A0A3N7JVN6_9BURK|nr:hemerythrin domain-containing protein [Albitalea terrae]RQP24929.1 hemerythrin domain-containing protein [Albitalea terrae]